MYQGYLSFAGYHRGMKCSGPQCTRDARAQKNPPLCKTHYYQSKRGDGALSPIFTPASGCAFDGCDSEHRAKGYCSGHYQQLLAGSSLTPLGATVGMGGKYDRAEKRAERGPCPVPGCPEMKTLHKGDYCREHNKRNAYVKHKYGVDLAWVLAKEAEQDGKCAICVRPLPLHVDHCHDTGLARGLLCGSCNRALGLMGDSVERLIAAARYLGGE